LSVAELVAAEVSNKADADVDTASASATSVSALAACVQGR